MENAPIGYVMVNREELRLNCLRVMAWVEYMNQKRHTELEKYKQALAEKPWWLRWFWEYDEDSFWSHSYWRFRTYDEKEAASACLYMLRNTRGDDVLLSIETANLLFDPNKQVTI